MKNMFVCFMTLILFVVIPACKKQKQVSEQINEVPTIVYDNYSGLKKGNYWVYGRFKVEKNGDVTNLNNIDSCFIDKDTLVRNHTYYRMNRHHSLFGKIKYYLRDSLHYIVNLEGNIAFSSEDFSTVFFTRFDINSATDTLNTNDTVSKITVRMADRNHSVQVPAGTFITSSFQTATTYYPKHLNPNAPNPQYSNMRYAKNIGLIAETEYFYSGTGGSVERRLLRYKVD